MAKGIKTGGRQKGTPNKTTAAIKEAFKQAFDDLGGVDALVGWARDNPTQFYQLASKLIPTEVNGNVDSSVTVQVVRYADDTNP